MRLMGFCRWTTTGLSNEVSIDLFGSVLAVVPYPTEEEALQIANDSPDGLGGYAFGRDREKVYEFASRLRAGQVSFNGAASNSLTPVVGYKQSGVGRSMGGLGLDEYLKGKPVYGFGEQAASLPKFGGRPS